MSTRGWRPSSARAAARAPPAVKGLGHLLDLLGDGGVANTHFAQRTVHVRKEEIEQILREGGIAPLLAAHPVENEDRVQRHHLETPVERIRHAKLTVEVRLPRLCHDLRVRGGHLLRQAAPEQSEHHGLLSSRSGYVGGSRAKPGTSAPVSRVEPPCPRDGAGTARRLPSGLAQVRDFAKDARPGLRTTRGKDGLSQSGTTNERDMH